MAEVLGIDIGGTGIKGAPVDVARGVLTAERIVVPTPHPATPDDVARTVAEVVAQFDTAGTVGAAFRAVIRQGRARTAANVDEPWIGESVATWLGKATDRPFVAINDADAAGPRTSAPRSRSRSSAGRRGSTPAPWPRWSAGSARWVFSGGIGERSATIRAEICRGLEHLGVRLDDERNGRDEPVISETGSACTVRVVSADEERVIARHTAALVDGS